jgi:hypothetical protein
VKKGVFVRSLLDTPPYPEKPRYGDNNNNKFIFVLDQPAKIKVVVVVVVVASPPN